MFLLNGDVITQLNAHKKLLRSSPKNVIKTWAQNTPHILAFINALIRRQVHTKQALLDVWKKDKNCKHFLFSSIFDKMNFSIKQKYISSTDLLQEYRNFLIESASDTAIKWPPIE